MTDKPVFKIPLREIVVAEKNKCVEEKEDVSRADVFPSTVSV